MIHLGNPVDVELFVGSASASHHREVPNPIMMRRSQSWKAWGTGVAFVLDEFYPLLLLDDAQELFARYDAVFYGVGFLIMAILLPAALDGAVYYWKRGERS